MKGVRGLILAPPKRAIASPTQVGKHARMHLLVAVAALSLTACGRGEWTKPSADTTCDDWLTEMTSEQQVDMAGPLLYSAVEAMGGDTSAMTDEVMTVEVMEGIRDEISQVCQEGSRLRTVPGALQEALEIQVTDIFDDVSDALDE